MQSLPTRRMERRVWNGIAGLTDGRRSLQMWHPRCGALGRYACSWRKHTICKVGGWRKISSGRSTTAVIPQTTASVGSMNAQHIFTGITLHGRTCTSHPYIPMTLQPALSAGKSVLPSGAISGRLFTVLKTAARDSRSRSSMHGLATDTQFINSIRLRKPTSFRWWEEQPTSYP